jgi:S-adenosylmethionine decarboxylase
MDCFEHFIRGGRQIYVGNHLIADLWGIINHNDTSAITESFILACKDAGATVLFSHCHPFGENSGTTGVIVLAESHLSWHHYPEVNMISIDIFMCGSANPLLAMNRINQFWCPSCSDIKTLKRGKVTKDKLPNQLTTVLA